MNKYSDFVKVLGNGENPSYILQGSLFDHIFTSQEGKELIELQSKYQNEDDSNFGLDFSSDSLVKDDKLSGGYIYWIYKEIELIELYKLKNFKVSSISSDFNILRIFFRIGTKFSLIKDKSVKSHFVALELLKNCLFIVKKLIPTKTVKKYEILSFHFFLVQILDVFSNMYDTKLYKQTEKVNVFVNKLSLLSDRTKHVKIPTNKMIQKFQKFLTFLDISSSSLLHSSSILFGEDSTCIKFYKEATKAVLFVSFCDFMFFTQSLKAGQLHVVKQTLASISIQNVFQEVKENPVMVKNNSLSPILFSFDCLISLVCYMKFSKIGKKSDLVQTELYLCEDIYRSFGLFEKLNEIKSDVTEKLKCFLDNIKDKEYNKSKMFADKYDKLAENLFYTKLMFGATMECKNMKSILIKATEIFNNLYSKIKIYKYKD